MATWSGFAYVAFVTDVYSRRIVGWNVAATLKSDILPLQALDMAAWEAKREGAVDLTLCDPSGAELDLGTPLDATPEQSDGACYTDAPLPQPAAANRAVLVHVLRAAGLVNYPTEWWHWSYGERYWAFGAGAHHAVYGPIEALE